MGGVEGIYTCIYICIKGGIKLAHISHIYTHICTCSETMNARVCVYGWDRLTGEEGMVAKQTVGPNINYSLI